MAQLKRIARSKAVDGVGYARRGVIHTVPDEMVEDLLATGEWEKVSPGEASGAPVGGSDAPVTVEAERVTEPAPSKPASKPKAKTKKRK